MTTTEVICAVAFSVMVFMEFAILLLMLLLPLDGGGKA